MDRLIVDGICERAKQIIDSAEFPMNMDILEKVIGELDEDVDYITYERNVERKRGVEKRKITIGFSMEDISIVICGNTSFSGRGNYSIEVNNFKPYRYFKTEYDWLWKDEAI